MSALVEKGYGMSALVGKAGEALVAAELMRRGVNVAYPAYDGGIDLLAYRELDFSRVVPIQIKSRASTGYNFQRSWFRIEGLVLVQVWHILEKPEFYIFRNLQDVEEALGAEHCSSESWVTNGGYNVTYPGKNNLERMRPHLDQWDRILDQLPSSNVMPSDQDTTVRQA